MHGDMCFSNILIDLDSMVLKLVDPKGSFWESPSIYGDIRYDLAKIRQCLVGSYDFITQGLFSFEVLNEASFNLRVGNNSDLALESFFNNKVLEFGLDIEEIKFLEAYLFLTMIPLHNDNPTRQRAFFLKSMELFSKLQWNNY